MSKSREFAESPNLRCTRRAVQTDVRDGIAEGRRPELVGGGLMRSLGAKAQVLALRRKGSKIASDARMLGGGEFIERVRAEAARREKETLRLSRHVVAWQPWAGRSQPRKGLAEADRTAGQGPGISTIV